MKVQVIELTLGDGRTLTALVPAFAEADGPHAVVVSIKVFEAYEDPTVHPFGTGAGRDLQAPRKEVG